MLKKFVALYLTTVKIAKKVSEKEWLNIAEYNYVQEDKNLLVLMTIENLEELLK